MEERNVLTNSLVKIIAFITLPIFLLIILLDIIVIYYSVANPEMKENKEFYGRSSKSGCNSRIRS